MDLRASSCLVSRQVWQYGAPLLDLPDQVCMLCNMLAHVLMELKLARQTAQLCGGHLADAMSKSFIRENDSAEATSDSMPSMSEEQLAAADLPDYIDQTIDPDNIRAAGQAVPNLRSLHRLLPHSGRALRPSSTSADNNETATHASSPWCSWVAQASGR